MSSPRSRRSAAETKSSPWPSPTTHNSTGPHASSPPPSNNSTTPPPSSAPLPPPSSSPPPDSAPPPSDNSTTPLPSSPPPPPSSFPPPATPSPPPPSGTIPFLSGISSSTALIAVLSVGAVVILLLLSVLCICCWKKKKRRPPPQYYVGQPLPPVPEGKDSADDGWPQNWQRNTLPNAVKFPPHPSSPSSYASHPSHFQGHFAPSPPPPPSPPQPMISSSWGSGSNYSVSERPLPPPSPGGALGISNGAFTYEELAKATDGFSDANLLGQGGFGYVHRGMLPNGKEIAVKQLKSGSGQGEREFQAEVEIISRVHHRHLVSLVGYCIALGKRLLVYEFVPNNTLEFHLHGKDQPTMDWPTRLKIALGSAKGLAYLHEDCHPKIIHRDIKAANILLDFKFEPRVSDFGLARIASDNHTHVSTRVMGTFGYMAPEYASSGKLTDKSDVFSFGVMLLELITGCRPVDMRPFMDDSLVDWARPLLTKALDGGNYNALIDPRLGNNYNHNEMARMVACAASCVRHSARHRPRMGQVARALEGDTSLEDLNDGIKALHSRLASSYGSSEYDSSLYDEDMKKFKKMALGKFHTNPSDESSATASEHAQIPYASSSEGQHNKEMEKRKDERSS